MRLVRNTVLPHQWKLLNDAVPGAAKSYCIHNFNRIIKISFVYCYSICFRIICTTIIYTSIIELNLWFLFNSKLISYHRYQLIYPLYFFIFR